MHIGYIAKTHLCCSCGGCLGVCPSGAISYQETMGGHYFPLVDDQKCLACGLCVEICPGIGLAHALIENMTVDPFIGVAQEAFLGRAADKAVFENSQSGGLASALLIHSLNTGQVSGAVTVVMLPGSPPRPCVQIARTPEEIYRAQKSKYCPVPLLEFLKSMKKEDRLALVGLPCQIHGLQNIFTKQPSLKKNIVFTVGLLCDRIMTFAVVDYFISKARAKKQGPTLLHFRDKSLSGYPGDVHVLSGEKTIAHFPRSYRGRLKDFFTPTRCRLCFDKMNIFSDITVGDPHGLEGVDRKRGESALIARTERGLHFVKNAQSNSAIKIRNIEYEQIVLGQNIQRKRKQWRGYSEAWLQMGHRIPNYYTLVQRYAPQSPPEKNIQALRHSMGLDAFSSKKEIFDSAESQLRRKSVAEAIRAPISVLKRLVRWILSRVFVAL